MLKDIKEAIWCILHIPSGTLDLLKDLWNKDMKNYRLPIKVIAVTVMAPLFFIALVVVVTLYSLYTILSPIINPLANLIAKVLFKQEK